MLGTFTEETMAQGMGMCSQPGERVESDDIDSRELSTEALRADQRTIVPGITPAWRRHCGP